MIKLRPATIQDLKLLKYWDTKQHVIDSDPDDEWNWEIELKKEHEWRGQLIAELNDVAIGFIQIIDPYKEETNYWKITEKNKRAIDIWIGEEKNLNKGYGTQMMLLAIKKCFNSLEVDGILIDPLKSNTKAHKFYEKLGFVFTEERKFDNSICYIYELKKVAYR